MKIGKIQRKSALAAACLLLFLAAVPRVARGALAIDTKKTDCSMAFSVSDDFGELDSLIIPVTVYRIADVNVSGQYLPDSAYSGIGLDQVSASTTAAEWEEMAEEAARITAPGALDEEGTIVGRELPVGDGQITLHEASGDTIRNLETGMYLVLAAPVDSAEYTYSFNPYLVSVPGNAYDGVQNNDDTWIYDVDVTLKPDRENRLGDLVISKTIDSYQPLGAADRTMFVFQVEVSKAGEAGAPAQIYYSNVVSLDFTAAGTQTLRIEDLPAGAVATVTEVYSGASYTIPAEEATVTSAPIAAEGEVSVSFNNRYNGGLNGGTGVVNHFEHDGTAWGWETQ